MASLKCGLKSLLVTPAYRPWVRRVNVFLPRTHWCAGSLVHDFGVDPEELSKRFQFYFEAFPVMAELN